MVFRATSFFAVFRLRFPPFLAASFGDTQTPLTLGGKEGTWDFQGGAAPPALTPIEETPAERSAGGIHPALPHLRRQAAAASHPALHRQEERRDAARLCDVGGGGA